MDEKSLSQWIEQGLTIAEIARRCGRAASTVALWMEKYSLEPAYAASHARRVPVDRAGLEELVERGLTIAQMASELQVTTVTIRRRLARFGLRTRRTRRLEVGAVAKDQGLSMTTLVCRYHGESEFVLEGRGTYRCKRCRADRVTRRRRKAKEMLVTEAGGRCRLCGYDRCMGALEFHHVDPEEKRFEVNVNGAAMSLDALREEARKCVLLCSNCHVEVESRVASLPIQ